MAEEVQKAPHEAVVVVADVPQAEKMTPTPEPPLPVMPVVEKEAPPVPETEEEPMKPKLQVEEAVETEASKSSGENDEKIPESVCFKEESTKVTDLSDSEKKGLQELRELVQEALNTHEFGTKIPPTPAAAAKGEEGKEAVGAVEEQKPVQEATPAPEEEHVKAEPEVVAETKDEVVKEKIETVETEVTEEKAAPAATDAVDDDGAKTVEAIEETIVAVSSSAPQEQSLPLEKVRSKVCINNERSDVILLKFLRARDFKVRDAFTMLKNTIQWRKEFGIDELLEQDLGDDLGKVVFMHGFDKEGHPVNDLKNSPGPSKRELRQATKQALQLLQDNYPEFVAKQVFINVPWWYLAVNKMISPFLTQRTRSKFAFASPSKSAETLLRYIAAEQIPLKYGGLSKDGEFCTADAVTEITMKPAAKHTVEFPVSETCLLTWEVRVVGWDVTYGAEFVPSAEESYTVIIQKARKLTATEEPVVCNSFKIGEPGKVVITIDNTTSKKKKLLYRLKTKVSAD
ncbi:hypothetical protein GH714_012245 [Hevea brasiliensis]|uniref:CRAL-TRIO domain-containing protein n=1 Tax=Hevea brasiliensis TaxID=3981 RepID=A0A6A6KVP8_HEVBR|nr:hypothetical protein GH714_012245 [Hevea brasiliensis]